MSVHKGKVRNGGTSQLAMVASWVGRPLCHLRVNDVHKVKSTHLKPMTVQASYGTAKTMPDPKP